MNKIYSEEDLRLCEEYCAIEHDLESNKEKLYTLLYKLGMDVTRPMAIEENIHRTLKGQIHTGKRFVGKARKDREWLNSGFASKEDYIYSTNDMSFREEMMNLSKEGFSDFYDGAPNEQTEEGSE